MGKLETVKIVSKDSENGYMVINKSDFGKKDTIFKEAPPKKPEDPEK